MGVIDGHDVEALRAAIAEALKAERPVIVHIHTVKGKGFAPAEEGGLEGMEKWYAAKPGSIVDRMPAPKKDQEAGAGEGVRRPRLDRAREAREAAAAGRPSTPPCSPTRSSPRRSTTRA